MVESPEHLLRQKLEQRLRLVEADPQQLAAVTAYAEARTTRCRRCHEVAGRSRTPETPLLAGQNPFYMVDQFQRYADGRRDNFLMRTLANAMNDDDKINLAIYYAKMETAIAGGGTPEQRQRGETIFKARCFQCHGEEGQGNRAVPRLAGQPMGYTVFILQAFRFGERGPIPSPIMAGIAQQLANEEMEAVAAFIANME
jgi:cytochrome c553